MKKLSLVVLAAVCTLTASYAQDLKLPALSPKSQLIQEFSTSSIEVSYSRPSMRGRKIFGDVVAFNEIWRTGANSATKLKFGEDVLIGGKEVKAGEYALYTIPGKEQWEVILNKGTSNWGASGYHKEDDVVRMLVKPQTLPMTVQTFTIDISNITYTSCNIDLKWEKTQVTIPVRVDNQARLDAAIDKAINKPNIPYFQAANYYYESGQDLNKAMEYVNKALTQNPNAFYMYSLKARIAQKQGDKEVALEAARQCLELAKGTAYENEYKRNMQKVIKAMK